MTTEIETWAESFQFSEELKLLEDLYQQQHRDEMQQQIKETSSEAPKAKASSAQPAKPETKDTAFLNQVSEKIAERLRDYVSKPEYVAEYLKIKELEKDNAAMAHQIQSLLRRVDELEAENEILRQDGQRYHSVFGKFYLKS